MIISVAFAVINCNISTLAVFCIDWKRDVICWALMDILASPDIWTSSDESSVNLSNSPSCWRRLTNIDYIQTYIVRANTCGNNLYKQFEMRGTCGKLIAFLLLLDAVLRLQFHACMNVTLSQGDGNDTILDFEYACFAYDL